MNKIYICDFEDSFTYNLFSDLSLEAKNIKSIRSIEVIKYKNILNFLQSKINSTDSSKEVIILGPGPGHPDDYSYLSNSIQLLCGRENLLMMGVCLGHQLIWTSLGYAARHSSRPVHGQTESLNLNEYWKKILNLNSDDTLVQRYNSLSICLNPPDIDDLTSDGWQLNLNDLELMMAKRGNILTYQFHPESVGTNCRSSFYSPIFNFLL